MPGNARRLDSPRPVDGVPRVWAVHVISPSRYPEDRFDRLVDGPGRRLALRAGAVLAGGFALLWGALSVLP